MDHLKSMKTPEPGPQLPHAQQAMTYIKEHLTDQDVVIFVKPRVLSFYAEKKAAYMPGLLSKPDELYASFQRMNAHYFLECRNKETKDERLLNFLEGNKDVVHLVWNNEQFYLYTDIPPS